MEIKLITSNKKQFLDLLLLADEQESMIDKYLERGEMFALNLRIRNVSFFMKLPRTLYYMRSRRREISISIW